MMIHVKDTSVTSRAVMATLRFENIAHQTISPSFVFVVTQMEAPKNWNLTRVSCAGLPKGPK
jgi:hypothetical protein